MSNTESMIITNCPHCRNIVVVNQNEINCAIFRHAVLKDTNAQIDPHSSKEVCDELAKNGKIYGCGKPFKLVRKNSIEWTTIKCGYI